MIPVLIVPYLRPGMVATMLASVDEPVGRTIVIDNGSGVPHPGTISLPANIGVAAAWNLGLKVTIDAPWWAIVNDDLELAPGDLARLAQQMEIAGPRVVTLDGFSAFGINWEALSTVGFFDESYMPAYCEDCDYEHRCKVARVPIIAIPSALKHHRSSTIGDQHYGEQNGRTYPLNVAYHKAKWGGGLRGGEQLATPFGRGGSVADWTADPRRYRDQRWVRRDSDAPA